MSQAADTPSLSLFQLIGFNVKRLRDDRGWSQEQLAVYSGNSRATVAKIEQALPVQTRQIDAVQVALEVPWSALLFEPDEGATRAYLDAIPPPFELIHGSGSGNGQHPLIRLAR